MHRKIINQYYILSCLFTGGGMQIISAVYVTFLQKHGLNLFEVNLVNACFFFTLFICEIPTGAFADIFGRKTAFVTACALTSASMFVYGLSHTFLGFVCAEILAGIGLTFRSGAFQSWLVDTLKHHGYEGDFVRIFGRSLLFSQIAGVFGAILGSYLAVKNPALPWFVGGSTMILVTITAFFIMNEEYFIRTTFSWKTGLASMKAVAVTSIRYGMTDKAVRFILIVTFVQIYAVQALNMYWQPFFGRHGIQEKHFGFLVTGMQIFMALGAFFASRIKGSGKERSIIIRSQIYVGLMVMAAAVSGNVPIGISLFLLHEIGRGFWAPMKDSYLHERIPSHERATITSFCAIAPHIGGAIGLVISGLIAQTFGISTAWIVAGSVLIFGTLLVRKNGVPHKQSA